MLNRKIFKEYEKSFREIKNFIKAKVEPIDEVQDEYNLRITLLRCHLDDNDMTMPAQVYPYNKEDQTTHKYISTEKGQNILNPDYRYKDIWKLNGELANDSRI